MTTLMSYTPIYNEQGINTNPDRNNTTEAWYCYKCENHFTTKGNGVDGYRYL